MKKINKIFSRVHTLLNEKFNRILKPVFIGQSKQWTAEATNQELHSEIPKKKKTKQTNK